MSLIDLHIHTEYSRDGSLTIDHILSKCSSIGISTIAVTDHNVVAANADAASLRGKYDVNVIPGIEIDTVFSGRIFHLLGYYIDYTGRDFAELYERANRAELEVVPRMIDKLKRLGFAVDLDEVMSAAEDGLPSESLVAGMIVADPANAGFELNQPFLPGGARADMPDFNFYLDYLAPGKPAFELRDYIPLAEAAALIKRNGGVPVLAHPGANLVKDDPAFQGIIDCGVAGIESFSSYHDDNLNHYYKTLAEQTGIFSTCGSDFHGPFKPGIQLGGHRCEIDGDEILKRLAAARS